MNIYAVYNTINDYKAVKEMVRIVAGRAGSGTGEYILNEIYKLAAAGEDRLLLLVPEQFTASKEREVLEKLGNRLADKVTVLNFKRLPQYLFSITGGLAKRYITPEGRYIFMAQALDEVSKNLQTYRNTAAYPELVDKLLQLAGEFKSYNVDARSLYGLTDSIGNETLKNKTADLAMIYETYCAKLESRFADSQDDLMEIASILSEKRLFSGYHIYFDGFTTLTPQRMAVTEQLITQAKESVFSVCSDDIEKCGDGELFGDINRMVRRVLKSAKNAGVPLQKPEYLSAKADAFSEDIRLIEQNLFDYSGTGAKKKACDVSVFCAADPYAEVDFIARRILKMVRLDGMRFRDFAVIGRSLEGYNGIIESVFSKYDIPVFIDTKRDMLTNPVLMMVFAALSCVLNGFTYNNVFTYLKSGLTELSNREVDELENYVYAWKIKGSRWTDGRDWTFHPDGFNRALDDDAQSRLEKINELKRKAVAPLKKLKEELASTDAKTISAAIYDLCESQHVPQKIKEIAKKLHSQHRDDMVSEYEQLWRAFISALDQMALAVTEPIRPQRYAEILKLMLSNTEIGVIPTSLDQVTLATSDRSMVGGVKHAFLIGMCEGDFPKGGFDGGLFTDDEKEELEKLGITLAPTTEKQLFAERYYAYTAFTAASGALTITFPKSDTRGKGKKPSYFITTLKHIFSDLTITYLDEAELTGEISRFDRLEGKKAAFDFYLTLPPEDGMRTLLDSFFDGDPYYQNRREEILSSAENMRGALKPISGDTAKKLYEKRTDSPTSLEKFAKCKFSYFCQYGLNLKPRSENEFDALETGTFMHYVIENLVKQYISSGKDFPIRESIDALIEQYIKEALPDFNERSARFTHLFRRLSKILYSYAANLIYELDNSDFKPIDFELKVGRDGSVSPLVIDRNEGIAVCGKIDRVDGYEKDGKLYVKIVDYKTGRKTLKYNELYCGIGLQMILYLFALWQNGKERYGKEIVPAGIVYSPVVLETVKADSRDIDEDKLDKERKKQNRGTGILINDDEILSAMDRTGAFDMISKKEANIATLQRLGALRDFTGSKLKELISEIRKGKIAVDPYRCGALNSCDFCEMADVCRFEFDKSKERALPQMTADEFWQIVEGCGDGR
ncbi:MAG: PD-(D/E)XK nuclease family protein [Bacillota bacterium]|nr:PD-(D/E)XK nuclease family protein [Bacillota bacterium]